MALKQANTLAPSNVSASGFALADARHIGGHRVVASLEALYALQDWQLLNPGESDTAMALGQQWYVKGLGFYRLTNWGSRKSAAGWTKVVDPNNIDTTLFQIVTDLPTTGINKNRIYLKKSASSTTQDIYDEFIYTGDTSAAYDASKWEKLGEYKPEVELTWDKIKDKPSTFTPSTHTHTPAQVGLGNVSNVAQIPLSQKGAANGVATLDASGKVTDGQLWDATEGKHGLMSAADKKKFDALNESYTSGEFSDMPVFDAIMPGDLTIEQLGINTAPEQVVYSVTNKTFLGRYGGKYYNLWLGAENYGTFSDNGIVPSTSKIFVCSSTNFIYRYFQNSLIIINPAADSVLSASSNNAIANSTVKTALDAKVAASTYNSKMSALDAKNTAQDTAIAGKVDKTDIEIMTTAEVDALFA